MTVPEAAGQAEPGSRDPGGSLPAWLLFLGLGTLEYLVISTKIDAKDLLAPTGLLSWLGGIGTLAPLGFVMAVAIFIAGGRAAREGLDALRTFRSSRRALLLGGALHVVLYAASFAVAKQVMAGESSSDRGWVYLWLGLLLGSALVLAASLWSRSQVVLALRKTRRALLMGLGVGVLAFLAGLLSKLLWPFLARLTLELVHALLTVVTPDPVAAPDDLLVGTGRFYVEIAPVCSGVEGIGLTLAFTGAYLYLGRADLRWPRALIMLPVSVMAIWLFNIVRITGLVLIGTWGWPEIALGGFHSKAGWVFFSLVALAAVIITRRMPWFRRPELPKLSNDGGASENPSAAYLVPMVTVLAVALLTGLASGGFDHLYFLRIPAAGIALWVYRRRLPRLDFARPWLSLAVGLAVGVVWIWGAKGGAPEAKIAVSDGLGKLSSTMAVLWMGSRIVGSVLVAPLVEELAFRGFLLRRISSRDFEAVSFRRVSWVALAVSSVAFGLLHSQWALGIFAGAAYGLVTVPYGRLSDAVRAHATSNATLVVYALVTGDWGLLS